MRTMKHLALAAMAATALALAGCGGGGSGDTAKKPMPDPDPAPTTACPGTDATSHAACVDEKKKALDEAKAALDAAKADQSSTQAQIAAAQKAYDDAMTAHTNAVAALAKYNAAQPPTYVAKAMATAIDGPTAPHAVADAIDGGKPPATNEDYTKGTWPVGKIANFSEAVYEDSEAGTSIVTYTDKAAAKGAKFKDYFPTPATGETATTAPAGPDGYRYASWGGGVTINDAGVITFDTSQTGFKGSVLSFAHGTSASSTRTVTADDDTSTTADETKFSMTGSFHGVTGTYKCTGASNNHCTVTTNAKSVITGLGGGAGWTFVPGENAGSKTVAGVLLDADYLDFGYWVTTTAGTDGPTYAVGTFAKGEAPRTNVPDNTSPMSATYKGGAAGLYTKRESSGDPGGGDLTGSGRFTATANLTAYFGTFNIVGKDGAAVDVSNSVRGTISNFMDGGQSIDSSWSVALQGGFGVGSGTIAPLANGPLTAAAFYGGANDNTAVPTGIAGEFAHDFTNGEVIGAFGATKTSK